MKALAFNVRSADNVVRVYLARCASWGFSARFPGVYNESCFQIRKRVSLPRVLITCTVNFDFILGRSSHTIQRD